MNEFHMEHTKFAQKLEEMDNVRYNLERIHSKIGLQGYSEFEEITILLRAFYDSIMSDLVFEANADDPANNYNTAWMSEVIDACKLSMGDDY